MEDNAHPGPPKERVPVAALTATGTRGPAGTEYLACAAVTERRRSGGSPRRGLMRPQAEAGVRATGMRTASERWTGMRTRISRIPSRYSAVTLSASTPDGNAKVRWKCP